MSDNLPFSEQYRVVARQWVDADAAARLLEELKTTFLNQKIYALGDMPYAHAEKQVKASAEWEEYINKMVAARTRANLLKAKIKYVEMRAMEWQSANATRRAEMRL